MKTLFLVLVVLSMVVLSMGGCAKAPKLDYPVGSSPSSVVRD